MDTVPLANLFGFFSLISYIATLIPSTFRIVFPQLKKSRSVIYLLRYRRQIGIVTFIFALVHGYLLVRKRNCDFYDWQTYWIYFQGVATFLIFALLAITSNNWSMRKLKRNWKKLHSLTYCVIFFLTWHVWDKMFDHWSVLTPLCLLGIITVGFLFMWRKIIEALPQLTSKKCRSKK